MMIDKSFLSASSSNDLGGLLIFELSYMKLKYPKSKGINLLSFHSKSNP